MKVQLSSISGPTIAAAIGSASVDLHFDNQTTVHISDLRIFRNQQGQLWVGWPMLSVQGKLTQIVSSSRYVHTDVVAVALRVGQRLSAGEDTSTLKGESYPPYWRPATMKEILNRENEKLN